MFAGRWLCGDAEPILNLDQVFMFPQPRLVAALLTVSSAFVRAEQSLPVRPNERSLSEVVVTATRFEDSSSRPSGNIYVVNREEIEQSPATNVPDLLAGLPSVNVIPLYGTLGIDSVVNLRAAGNVGTAASNTLILLNGQRMNPIDSGSIDWSLVPIASIERIEIMPGSGTVMYGDRASGGVINIVTRKGRSSKSAQAGFGSYGLREVSAQTGWEVGSADASIQFQYGSTDGWRKNSDQERYSFGGRLGLGESNSTHSFVEVSAFNESLGMPGGLWSAEYEADPTKSRHPKDRSNREGFRIRPGVRVALTSAIDFDADLSISKDKRSGYSGITNPKEQTRDLSREFISFSPKLRAAYVFAGLSSKTTFGYDFYRGSADSLTARVGYQEYTQNAAQTSHALYLQNIFSLTDQWSINLGWRGQRIHQSASQSSFEKECYDLWPVVYRCTAAAISGNVNSSRSAHEVGLTYEGNHWRAYARSGLSYRFPNTDELYGLDPISYNPSFVASLRPQHGVVQEVGSSIRTELGEYAISFFEQDTKDEITSDPTGGNMNLARTRRRGIDLSAKIRFSDNLRGNFSITRQDSMITEGMYAPNQVPAIPPILAGAGISWSQPRGIVWSARVSHVGKRRYGDDYSNDSDHLAGYTTVDLSARTRFQQWTFELRIANATNIKYAAYGGYGFNSTSGGNDTFYYPADPRSLRFLARYDF